MLDNLVIVLYGQTVLIEAERMKSFWRKYIDIQKSIAQGQKVTVVGHLRDAGDVAIIQNIYRPSHLSCEALENVQSEFICDETSLLPYEERLKEIFISSKSFEESIAMLNVLPEEKRTVLMTTWNNSDCKTKQIVYDSALPADYIYLPYSDDVDLGYDHDWIWGSQTVISQLAGFSSFIAESMRKPSEFIEHATRSGWPMALSYRPVRLYFFKFFQKLVRLIIRLINFNRVGRLHPSIKHKIIGLKYRTKNFLLSKLATGENTLELGTNLKTTFPLRKVLNVASLFKGFIFSKKLRGNVRFLEEHDFECVEKGQLILPLKFYGLFIIRENPKTISWSLIELSAQNLPVNCESIIVVLDEKYKDENCPQFVGTRKLVTVFIKAADDSEINFYKALEAVSEFEEEYAYYIPYEMPLVAQADKVYLNAVLHFLTNSNEAYVALTSAKAPGSQNTHNFFPDLAAEELVQNLALTPSILKVRKLLSYFSAQEALDESKRHFSVVESRLPIGNSRWVSKRFSHLVLTNLSESLKEDQFENALKKAFERFQQVVAESSDDEI